MQFDPAAFHAWPADRLFVYCSKCADDNTPHHGGAAHGPRKIQLASLRSRCSTQAGGCGQETIVLDGDLTVGEAVATRGDLLLAMLSGSTQLPGTCARPECPTNLRANPKRQAYAQAYLRCSGYADAEGEPKCRARSDEGDCCFLAQLVEAEGEDCAVNYEAPEDGRFFRFDPCGCLISVEAFITSVNVHVTGGQGAGLIRESPLTGEYAFACPMMHEGSFVHDIHHYKCCGEKEYRLIKDWAVRQHEPPEGGGGAGRGAGEGKQDNDEEDPMQAITRRIQEVLVLGGNVPCPLCNVAGQKDGECRHVKCQNQDGGHVGYKYVCMS